MHFSVCSLQSKSIHHFFYAICRRLFCHYPSCFVVISNSPTLHPHHISSAQSNNSLPYPLKEHTWHEHVHSYDNLIEYPKFHQYYPPLDKIAYSTPCTKSVQIQIVGQDRRGYTLLNLLVGSMLYNFHL